jgi:hypothetical protein
MRFNALWNFPRENVQSRTVATAGQHIATPQHGMLRTPGTKPARAGIPAQSRNTDLVRAVDDPWTAC